jgi:hypothetical protein
MSANSKHICHTVYHFGVVKMLTFSCSSIFPLPNQTHPFTFHCRSTIRQHWSFVVVLWSDQANYIDALAVSISTIFEPAKGTLGGFFSSVGGFFMTLGELFYDIGWTFQIWPLTIQLYSTAARDSVWSFNVYVCNVFFWWKTSIEQTIRLTSWAFICLNVYPIIC